MSLKRRSCRSKKSVDYCGTNQSNSKDLSDDDFENDFGPPSKKSKLKSRDVKYENRKHGNEKCRPKERLSVNDKLYQRDVDKAIQLSLDSSRQSSQEEKDENSGEKNTCKEREVKDEDGDYQPEEEHESESEEDCDNDENENDSDFGGKENNKKKSPSARKGKTNIKLSPKTQAKQPSASKKVNCMNKPTCKAQTEEDQKIPFTRNPLEKSPPVVSRKNILPSVKTPISGTSNKTSYLGRVVIKNPGPPIRVGLSRNMKVKPLHPKISVAL